MQPPSTDLPQTAAAPLGPAPAEARPINVASRCVIGAKHIRDGRPCQDAVGVRQCGAAVVIAAADGHGTASRGGEGAEMAVLAALEVLEGFIAQLEQQGVRSAAAVRSYAEHPMKRLIVDSWTARVPLEPTQSLYDYGTTLLFWAVTPDWTLCGQLGDGDLLVVDARSTWRPIPPDTEAVGEETTSLCMRDASSYMQVRTFPTPMQETLLLVSTDGYAKSYARDEDFTRIGPDYLKMIRQHGLREVDAALDRILQAVTSGGSGDDITFGIVHLPPHGIQRADTEVGSADLSADEADRAVGKAGSQANGTVELGDASGQPRPQVGADPAPGASSPPTDVPATETVVPGGCELDTDGSVPEAPVSGAHHPTPDRLIPDVHPQDTVGLLTGEVPVPEGDAESSPGRSVFERAGTSDSHTEGQTSRTPLEQAARDAGTTDFRSNGPPPRKGDGPPPRKGGRTRRLYRVYTKIKTLVLKHGKGVIIYRK